MRTVSSKSAESPKKSSVPTPTKKKTPVRKMPIMNNESLKDEERQEMIREAAYYLAEKCEFNPVMTEKNWLLAEKQIDKNY